MIKTLFSAYARRLLALPVIAVMLMVSATPVAAALPVTLVESGFSQPLYVTHAGDSRLFVVEKSGLIKIVGGGTFLDISTKVSVTSERGLLGLAFDPDYATNGLFYVDYTRGDGDVVVAEYRRSSLNPNRADPSYERILLRIEHSNAANHNGGWIGFSGGLLYIAVGDAANGANAQSLNNLLGKILRINPNDPDGAGPKTYGIPGNNPYVGKPGMDEIWAYGFRNHGAAPLTVRPASSGAATSARTPGRRSTVARSRRGTTVGRYSRGCTTTTIRTDHRAPCAPASAGRGRCSTTPTRCPATTTTQ